MGRSSLNKYSPLCLVHIVEFDLATRVSQPSGQPGAVGLQKGGEEEEEGVQSSSDIPQALLPLES